MPVKHYDNNRFKIMPISGRHTSGLEFLFHYFLDNVASYTEKEKVTCKRCIKLFKK